MSRFRVMTWNVLEGGGDRFDRILQFVAASSPDLLVLQECLGWDDGARLAAIGAALGIAEGERHLHLGLARPRPSGRRYHVAVASRHPIVSARDHADPAVVGHCLTELRIDIGGIMLRVFGAHFDYHDEDTRLREVAHLRSLLDPGALRDESAWHLLLGDLNALSPRDPYPPDFDALLCAAGNDKYGHPPRFDVITDIESFGWVDALYARSERPDWITCARDRAGVHIDYRTDYIFASPALAAGLTGAQVHHVPADVSDHCPVSADFTAPAAGLHEQTGPRGEALGDFPRG